MRVAFRVDASLEIGTGHTMRCLALADALTLRGAKCIFIVRKHPGHMVEVIRQQGYDVATLPAPLSFDERVDQPISPPHARWLGTDWSTDALQTLSVLGLGECIDWLVVDHYALDARWEQRIHSVCSYLMVIDDLADRAHCCDLLLDQNLGRNASEYANLLSPACGLLIGPDYALLRSQFAVHRPAALARINRSSTRPFQNLLVMFGGVDNQNFAKRTLEALIEDPLSKKLCITILMGSHAPGLADVIALAARMPSMTVVKVDATDVAELMVQSDVAVGAAGTSALERCCMGLPTVTLILAENQRSSALALQRAGCVVLVDNLYHLTNVIPQLLEPDLRVAMEEACFTMVDGLGTKRVAYRMFKLWGTVGQNLRAMTCDDLEQVFSWRNHPQIRQAMCNRSEISWDDHCKWFNKISSNPSHQALIYEENGVALGFVQFTGVMPGATVDWGFYASPMAPKGVGLRLGRLAIDFAFGDLMIHKVCGEVFVENQASINLHRNLGFSEEGVLREQKRIGLRYKNQILFGLLKREWAKVWANKNER